MLRLVHFHIRLGLATVFSVVVLAGVDALAVVALPPLREPVPAPVAPAYEGGGIEDVIQVVVSLPTQEAAKLCQAKWPGCKAGPVVRQATFRALGGGISGGRLACRTCTKLTLD